MALLVDIGNTRIKWCVSSQGKLGAVQSSVYERENFPVIWEQQWADIEEPARILVSNVAGTEVAHQLAGWCAEKWDKQVQFLVPQAQAYGVRNAYLEPARLGADRWAYLIAVHQRVRAPACIVDCGSAITIDAIDAQGQHLGGLIVPGLAAMRRALAKDTACIEEHSDGGEAVFLLARETRDAVAGGTLYAVVAVIDRVAGDIEAELGGNMACILTGGDGPQIADLLSRKFRYEADLVLQGLAVVEKATQ